MPAACRWTQRFDQFVGSARRCWALPLVLEAETLATLAESIQDADSFGHQVAGQLAYLHASEGFPQHAFKRRVVVGLFKKRAASVVSIENMKHPPAIACSFRPSHDAGRVPTITA